MTERSPRINDGASEAEYQRGLGIVQAEFGLGFEVDFDYPRNVGCRGDERHFGKTIAITGLTKLTREARRRWYNKHVAVNSQRGETATEDGCVVSEDDKLGRVSRRVTNELDDVTKVLLVLAQRE